MAGAVAAYKGVSTSGQRSAAFGIVGVVVLIVVVFILYAVLTSANKVFKPIADTAESLAKTVDEGTKHLPEVGQEVGRAESLTAQAFLPTSTGSPYGLTVDNYKPELPGLEIFGGVYLDRREWYNTNQYWHVEIQVRDKATKALVAANVRAWRNSDLARLGAGGDTYQYGGSKPLALDYYEEKLSVWSGKGLVISADAPGYNASETVDVVAVERAGPWWEYAGEYWAHINP